MGRLDRMVCGAFFQLNIIGFEDSEGKPRLSTHLSKTRLAYETQHWNEMIFKLRRFWNPKGASRTFNLNQIISLIRTLSPWEVNESTQGPWLVSYRADLGLGPQIDILLSSLSLHQSSLPFILPYFSCHFFQCEIYFTLIIIAPIQWMWHYLTVKEGSLQQEKCNG